MGWKNQTGMNWSLEFNSRSAWTVDIPENTIGDHTIVKYNMDNFDSWHNYWKLVCLQGWRESPTMFDYTVLLKDGMPLTVMQDTFCEFEEHQWLWGHSTGDILITGLGIGFVNEWLIKAPGVTSVTIIEKEQDVIDLVWDHCAKDERFTLIHADADTWDNPDELYFDTIWIDHVFNTNDHRQAALDKYTPWGDNIKVYADNAGLDNYYEINEETGMLELREKNERLPWCGGTLPVE